MENTFKKRVSSNKFMFFDLKGSTFNRLTKFKGENEKWWIRGERNQNKCMKDKNLIEINNDLNKELL